MILIVTDAEDLSTLEVIDWLDRFKENYLVITDREKVVIEYASLNSGSTDFSLLHKKQRIRFSEISYVWYRRGKLNFKLQDFPSTGSTYFDNQIKQQLSLELSEIFRFVWSKLKEKSINTQIDNFTSKLILLELCKKHNISIPETLITTSKSELQSFYDNHKSIISKNISPGVFIKYNDSYFGSHTLEIKQQEIDSMADRFAPILIQKMIHKSFEVRSFFIDGSFYSSAILSQNDEQTRIDFRNYNNEKPNRTPPYQLPYHIQEKLRSLMHDANLNSGSIDLIVDKNGDYCFLEVNPVGQFKQVSYPCNYHLEKVIAKKLANV